MLRSPVHATNPINLDLEILPPAGTKDFRQGDRIEMDLELITLPREADDYYGPNDSFRRHLERHPRSWKTTYREAVGNQLDVAVSGGKMLQNYPLVVQAEQPEVIVAINGGVGAVPLRFQGLSSSQGYRLYQVVDGERIPFDQSVHGNDFWQTEYDAVSKTYSITFNLPLDELDASVWSLSLESQL